MPQIKPILFISDLHLSPKAPELTALFLDFLKGPAATGQALYILGDLFDVWVGADIDEDFQKQIQAALLTLAQQSVKLYFMNGNRDFLITQAFLKKAGCQKIPDPSVISLYGTGTLLAHGDRYCTQDIGYQRYRKVAQHPLTKLIFNSLPKSSRVKIAQKLRANSHKHQKGKPMDILDVTPLAILEAMTKYDVSVMIHGHVHRPKIHSENEKHRLVLGDWGKEASFIMSQPDETVLATYSPAVGIQVQARLALNSHGQ